MKTVKTLVSKLVDNNNQTAELIKQIQEIQDNNEYLLNQLLSIDSSYIESIEEEDPSPGLQTGDRAVVLSPDLKRRGLTGHVTTVSKSKLTVDFCADNSKATFPVRVSNLFKLKRKTKQDE